jgi:hypothetical protein
MTMAQAPRRVEAAIRIDSKGAKSTKRNGSTTVAMKAFVEDIGASQYSIPLYVTEADADQMEAGGTYYAILQEGRLKTGKLGNYDTDFFWDWVGFADGTAVPEPPTQPSEQSNGRRGQPEGSDRPSRAIQTAPIDRTRVSIERQVAAKNVTDLMGADKLIPEDGESMEACWLRWADLQANWIQVPLHTEEE